MSIALLPKSKKCLIFWYGKNWTSNGMICDYKGFDNTKNWETGDVCEYATIQLLICNHQTYKIYSSLLLFILLKNSNTSINTSIIITKRYTIKSMSPPGSYHWLACKTTMILPFYEYINLPSWESWYFNKKLHSIVCCFVTPWSWRQTM